MALNPFDESLFQQRKQQVNSQYRRGLADVDDQYRQFQAVTPLQQQRFAQSWQDAGGRVANGMGRRGLLNSGVYRRALTDFARQQNDASLNFQMGLADREAGFSRARQQLGDDRLAAMLALQAERQGRRAQTAAMLRQLAGSDN